MDQIQEINYNWDKLVHDSPIYWKQGKLAGDFVPDTKKKEKSAVKPVYPTQPPTIN